MKANVYRILGWAGLGLGMMAGSHLHAASPLQFSEPRFVATTNGSFGKFIVADDLNNDGSPDIVSASTGTPARINVLLSSPDGNFQTNTVYNVSVAFDDSILQIVAVDLNHDGYKDLLTTGLSVTIIPPPSKVGILLNQGNGRYGTVNFLSTPIVPYTLVVTDLNRDTHPDLICAHATIDAANWVNLSTFLGDGAGHFTTFTNYYFTLPNNGNTIVFTGLASGDLNQDGSLDLVATASQVSQALVLLGDTNGIFSFHTNLVMRISSTPRDPQIADLNGDQIPDLVIVASQNYNAADIFWGLGGGNFSGRNSFATFSNPRHVTTGDFDGDGFPELVSGRAGDFVCFLQNNGRNLFTKVPPSNYASGEKSAVADMNQDGRPDLLTVLGTGVNIYTNLTAPSLQINADSSNVRLRWPTWPGYQLESAPAITGSWTTVTNAPVLTNDVKVLTLPRPLAQEFFRLVKP